MRVPVRVMAACPVCLQSIPTVKGRFTFHLARGIFSDRYAICPGSESGPRSREENPPKKRSHRCGPCRRGNHFLCNDCDCATCSKLDLPHTVTISRSTRRAPQAPSSAD